jgi:hypothetical protein
MSVDPYEQWRELLDTPILSEGWFIIVSVIMTLSSSTVYLLSHWHSHGYIVKNLAIDFLVQFLTDFLLA